jgi:hypothetical protein
MNMIANGSTDRTAFRAALAQVAERAKAILPQEVNGRLEGAVALVLQDDIWPQEDGSIHVGSCTDATKVYRLVGHTCECKDFTDGQAPQSWCRHRIAAGLHRRVRELLAAQAVPTPAPPALPLPEAPASCNVYLLLGGHKVQVTLRDTDESRMLARLQVLLDQHPMAQPHADAPAPSTPPRKESWCHAHQTAMKQTTKDGRSWFSHYDEIAGRWCKGR